MCDSQSVCHCAHARWAGVVPSTASQCLNADTVDGNRGCSVGTKCVCSNDRAMELGVANWYLKYTGTMNVISGGGSS